MNYDLKSQPRLLLLILAALAAASLGIVCFLQTQKIASLTQSVAALTAQVKQLELTQQTAGTVPTPTTPKQLVAKNFGAGVGFSYPAEWGEYTVRMTDGGKGKEGQVQFHNSDQIASAFFPSKDFVWNLVGEGLPHPMLFPPMKPVSCAGLKKFKTANGYAPFVNIDSCEAVKSVDEMPTLVFHAPAKICDPYDQSGPCESTYSAILYFTNYGDYPVFSLTVIDYPQSHLHEVEAVAKTMYNEFKPE